MTTRPDAAIAELAELAEAPEGPFVELFPKEARAILAYIAELEGDRELMALHGRLAAIQMELMKHHEYLSDAAYIMVSSLMADVRAAAQREAQP